MTKNPFCISERMGLFAQDNLINYNSGPLKVTISTWSELIVVSSPSVRWNHLLPFFLETAREAWDLREEQIIVKEDRIEIKLTYATLKLYVEHAIVF